MYKSEEPNRPDPDLAKNSLSCQDRTKSERWPHCSCHAMIFRHPAGKMGLSRPQFPELSGSNLVIHLETLFEA